MRHRMRSRSVVLNTQNLSYSTDFASPSENPIHESSRWINGGEVGLIWSDVAKTPGLGYCTQVTNGYNDSIAVLSGNWPPNQYAEGRIHKAQNSTDLWECELLLRFEIIANRARGYECYVRCFSGSGFYATLARWNGPTGEGGYAWDNIDGYNDNVGVVDGDVCRAQIVGTVITFWVANLNGGNPVYVHDTLNDTGHDGFPARYASGSPGIGFYNTNGPTGNGQYGWSHYSVTASS